MKHQDTDAPLRLSTSCKNESTIKYELLLQNINHIVDGNNVETMIQIKEYRVANINNTGAVTDTSGYDPSNFAIVIHAQKNSIFCLTATAHLGRADSKFSTIGDQLFVRQSTADGVIQTLVPPLHCHCYSKCLVTHRALEIR